MKSLYLLLALPALTFAQLDPVSHDLIRGAHLTAEQAMKLEAAVAVKPDDATMRADLLGYYYALSTSANWTAAATAARTAHVEWLITHRPESRIAAHEATWLLPVGDAASDDAWRKLAPLWEQQVKTRAKLPAVAAHAALFFAPRDMAKARAIVDAALAATPKSVDVLSAAAVLDALVLLNVSQLDAQARVSAHNNTKDDAAGQRALRELREATDGRVLCAGGAALLHHGATLINREAGRAVLALAGELLRKGIARAGSDLTCIEYGLRAEAWGSSVFELWTNRAAPSQPLTVIDGRVAHLVETSVAPRYPEAAKATRTQGVINAALLVGADGKVIAVQIVGGPSVFAESSRSSLLQWRYRPFVQNGAATAFLTDTHINYTIGR